MIFILFVTLFARAQGADFASTQLAPSIHMLQGDGGNITALTGTDGTFLVDVDFAEMAEKLRAKLKELDAEAPRFIVNTHFHYDHSGGNEVFGKTATIIAAAETRRRLMSEQTLWKKRHPALSPRGWPSLVFEKSFTMHLNGEKIRIVHLPSGHTDGDTVVFFEQSKIVSMGDLYFAGMFPIFHPEHKGSLNGYLRNIGLVLREAPDGSKIVPGHGPLSTKIELIKYRKMIRSSVAHVKRKLAAGKSLGQIQKEGLPQICEPYSRGYVTADRWIEMIYRDLEKDR